MMAPPRISLLILAGGASRRMGRDKASLPFPGPADPPLVQRAHDQLRPLTGHCIVAGRTGFDLACDVVRDVVGVTGPLGGLLAGLVASPFETVLVAAADTPFPSRELASNLISIAESRPQAQATFCLLEGRVEPFFAVYRKSAVPELIRAAGEGRGSRGVGLRRATAKLQQMRVREIIWRGWDPEAASFRSCNTPQELAEAARLAASPKEVQSERVV